MDHLIELLVTYGYIVLFLGVVIEGEIFPLVAGFLVSLSLMDLYTAILVTFAGAVVGDIIWFEAARRWGARFVERYGKWFFLNKKRLRWLEEHFTANGKKTLAITKFIYSFGHSSIIVAGIARMNFKEFLKVDVPASLLWSVLFIFLGNFFGSSFSLLQNLLRDVAWAAVIIFSLVVGVQWYIRKRLTKVV